MKCIKNIVQNADMNQNNITLLDFYFVFIFTLLILTVYITVSLGGNWQSDKVSATTVPTPTPVLRLTATPTPTSEPLEQWEGKVSHYSESGCLGCSPTLTMANGERLDDTKLTLAFNHLPMNTVVKLTNLNNGKSVVAKVTDTGGFEKYNRIADLSLATQQALETKTDVSVVKIEVLP